MKANRTSLNILIATLIVLLVFSGCANKEDIEACLDGKTYGFWNGLWHGIIAPVDLILMLFREDITVYAQNNNGAWYAFGFILGSGGWGILGSKSACKGKKRRNKEFDE